MNIIIDRQLIEYAIGQNTRLRKQIVRRYLVIVGLWLLMMGLSGALSVTATQVNVEQPVFYRTDGTSVSVEALINPSNVDYVRSVAQRWAGRLLSLHFRHTEQQLNDRRSYFYRDAFQTEYLSPLLASNNGTTQLDFIRDNNLVITAVATGPARITNLFFSDFKFGYVIEVPVIQTITGLTEDIENIPHVILLTLVDVPRNEYPHGLAITHMREL